jgi:hypothetical protein
MRLDRLMSESLPEFELDDAQMYLDLYRDADPKEAFNHFEEQRETNIEYLRDLPSAAGQRKALHRTAVRPSVRTRNLVTAADSVTYNERGCDRTLTLNQRIFHVVGSVWTFADVGRLIPIS